MNPDFKKLEAEIKRLTQEVSRLSNDLKIHTHSGQDGSNPFFQNSIRLNQGSSFIVGNTSLDSLTYDNVTDGIFQVSSLATGKNAKSSGIQNKLEDTTLLQVEHRSFSNGVGNDSIYTGVRSPFYTGKCSVTSGDATLTQQEFKWAKDSLAGSNGAYVLVFDTNNPGQFDGFEIISNTAGALEASGNFTFTDSEGVFVIFQPVYMGFSTFPWRRLYTMDGIAGGIRFGLGDTNGSQNALLYTDGADLKFRRKNGTITTVTVS